MLRYTIHKGILSFQATFGKVDGIAVRLFAVVSLDVNVEPYGEVCDESSTLFNTASV
jgi:hypothetical protein